MRRRNFYNAEMREGYARRFAAELAAVLYELGVTHRALAAALGVTRHTVDSWTRIADPKIPGERNLQHLHAELERRQDGAGRRVLVAAGQPAPAASADRDLRATSSPLDPAAIREPQAPPPGNIPPALSGLIGRERDIAGIRELLPRARLVTLTGAGGIGKTRLALEVVRGARGFAAGTWLVELDTLADPARIPAACAGALGLRLPAGADPTAALAQQIADRALLLVLDNCEHLVTGCARLVERLLQEGPQLQVLATSRETLGCEGEVVWRVPALSIPPGAAAGAGVALAALQQSEAGQLFFVRAQQRQPGFALTAENAPAVARICTRLDGMPLAIELAAARLPGLPAAEIARRLDASLQLLTHGKRTSLPRHQALQACLDWSHDLLEPAERVLFRRLAVFAGGWTLEAAEAVCAGDGLSTYGVLSNLLQLVEKSLVVVEQAGGQTRHRFLEPVRQYARERLTDDDEAARLSHRHALHFTALVERVSPTPGSAGHPGWSGALEGEVDNVRAALAWATAGGDPPGVTPSQGPAPDARRARTELGARLAAAMYAFWSSRGETQEAIGWLQRVQAGFAPAEQTATRARVLSVLATCHTQANEYADVRHLAEESATIWRALGNRPQLSLALRSLGTTRIYRGDLAGGREALAESVALLRELGDSFWLAQALFVWGNAEAEAGDLAQSQACLQECLTLCSAASQTGFSALPLATLARICWLRGDYAAARQLAEEGLAVRTAVGDAWPVAVSTNSLADVLRCQGDHARAAALAQASLTVFRQCGDDGRAGWALYTLGQIARASGALACAGDQLRESLLLRRREGHRGDVILCLAALVVVAQDGGAPERVALLCGAVDTRLAQVPVRWSPVDASDYTGARTAARQALGEPRFTAAWDRGAGLPEEEVIATALAG